MIKSVIFDFDGVIANTEQKRFKDLQEILIKYNRHLTNSDFPNLIGRKTEDFLKNRFPEMNKSLLQHIQDERRSIQQQYTKSIPLIEGIQDLIMKLHDTYTLAITTGSSHTIVKTVLECNNLLKYFTVIVAGEDYAKSKSDIECYILTLKKLKIKPSEAIIIEDSGAGITAGKSAGCKVFALKNKYNGAQITHADRIFNNHKEISSYFKTQLHSL
ncbi:MAG: HAD family phosphatase [Candidatus Woesearchaeota archaeon]